MNYKYDERVNLQTHKKMIQALEMFLNFDSLDN